MMPHAKEPAELFVLQVDCKHCELPPSTVDDNTLVHTFIPRIKGDFRKFLYHALLTRQSDDLWDRGPGMGTWAGIMKGATKWSHTGGQRLEQLLPSEVRPQEPRPPPIKKIAYTTEVQPPDTCFTTQSAPGKCFGQQRERRC